MIRSIGGVSFTSELDLNMGYDHIKLVPIVQNLCTIVFPWDTHGYEDCHNPGIFQNFMSKLVQVMEYVKTNFLS
jgi:hypothetical protein